MSTKFLFFFSSRRRHTRLQGDWSSDVCSSDLDALEVKVEAGTLVINAERGEPTWAKDARVHRAERHRSEERRVGKSVDLGGRRIIKKKKKRYTKKTATTTTIAVKNTNVMICSA